MSPKFSLNKEDLKRISLHLMWYGLGYGAIAVFKELSTVDFGTFTPIVGLLTGTIIDIISRWAAGK